MIRLIAQLALMLVLLMPAALATAQTPQVTAELDAEETLVGQPLVLRIKILVPSWMPKPPVFPTIEMPSLMVRLPERATGPVSETINGETWSGVQRAYRLYPLSGGVFTLPEGEITLTYAEPGKTDPITYTAALPVIRFTATVPEAARDLDPLIIAENFALTQDIDGPTDLAAGDAVTRSVTASISGTTPVMIPQLIPDPTDPALRAYPKEPVVSETENRGDLSGSRVEVTTYIGQQTGQPALPPIEIRWYNLTSGAVETATLPGLDLTVTGAAPKPAPMDPVEIAMLVLKLVLGLVAAWGLWRYGRPRIAAQIAAARQAWQQSEPYAHRQVLAAIRHRDLGRVTRALDHWSLSFPDRPAAPDLAAALGHIGARRYGPAPGPVNSRDWQVLRATYLANRRACRSCQNAAKGAGGLPPLNP